MTPGLYPSCRCSSTHWVDAVPARWEVRRIKTLFREIDERNGNQDRELLSLTRRQGLIPHRESTTKLASAADHSKYKVCKPGNLVMNRMQAWSGMFAVPSMEGIVSPDYAVFEPIEKCNLGFYERLFKTPEMVGQFAQHSKGIGTGFNRLYTESFGAIFAVTPPLPEQRAIARYLDYMDRRIQRYIKAKERLIELLEEQKRAVINKAVTRGLDPDAALKPSGVEWLGDIPAHWEARRLHTIASVTPSNVDKHINDDETPIHLCNYVDVYKNDEITRDLPFMAATAKTEEIEKFQLKKHDVLITKDSETWDDIGVPTLVADSVPDVICGYHLAVLKPKESMLGGFLAWSIRSDPVAYQFHVVAKGVTRYGISRSGLQSVRVPVPPIEEQQSIFDYVKSSAKDVESSVATAKRQIELISEYRTRLIADVVTGKLDVRDEAANLPKHKCEHKSLGDATAVRYAGTEARAC